MFNIKKLLFASLALSVILFQGPPEVDIDSPSGTSTTTEGVSVYTKGFFVN